MLSLPQSNIFEQARTIPVPDVAARYGLELRKQGKNHVALCPFHPDRRPSLVVYPNGWKCYGCQAHGDGINLMARLLNIRPHEAAQQICRDFGLLLVDGPVTPAARRKAAEADRRREEEAEFRRWCKQAYNDTCLVYRNLNRSLKTFDDYERLSGLVHIAPVLEHILDTLAFGSRAERLELFKNREQLGWCRDE